MIGRLQTLFNLRRSLRVWISVTFGTLALALMLVFGWLIDVSMRENVDPQVFSQLQQLTWVYGTFLVGVFILVGWLVAGQITRPLSQIAATAHRISQEHSEEAIPIFPGHDEVASLSLSLNHLVSELNQQKATLQKATVNLDELVVERTRQLTALYDVLAVSNDLENDLPTVLNKAVVYVLAVTGTSIGGIHLLSKDGLRLETVTQINMLPAIAAALQTLPIEQPLAHDILHQDAYLHIVDIATDLRTASFAAHSQNWQLLGFPIRKGRKNLGALTIVLQQAESLDSTEIGLFLSLTDQLAIIVENAHLRRHSEQLAVVEERNRLARELHDSVTQALYSTTLFAEAGQRNAKMGKMDKAMDYLAEVGETSHQALKEMRLLVHKLRPSALDKEGLIPALEQRLKAVEERAGIQQELVVVGELHLSRDTEMALYFIAQEALNNALKHARATAVMVQFTQLNGTVELMVQDDGQGFVWETAVAAGGLGLTSLRERATQLNGEIEIQSTPAKGTTVVVRLPVGNPIKENQ